MKKSEDQFSLLNNSSHGKTRQGGIRSQLKDLLVVENLNLDFIRNKNKIQILKNISLSLRQGQTLGLTGQSGSGKTVLALSIMKLLSKSSTSLSGKIFFKNKNLLELSEKDLEKIRGHHISMVFQNPMTSLNPVLTVGSQIVEVLRQKMNKKESWEKATELIHLMGIEDPKTKIKSYPFEMSGGQRQRIMMAIAMACEPDLLIADEPTTALDSATQKQIMELIVRLQNEKNMAVLFITHNLDLMKNFTDEIMVLSEGQITESFKKNHFSPSSNPSLGSASYRSSSFLNQPEIKTSRDTGFLKPNENKNDNQFKTTKLQKTSDLSRESQPGSLNNTETPLLEIKNLEVTYPIRSGLFKKASDWKKAVDRVSLNLKRGQTLGLVGQSGSGKTSLGLSIVQLIKPLSGQILYKGQDLGSLNSRQMMKVRRKMQIIFQDADSSLNPRHTVGSAVMEPMRLHKTIYNDRETLDRAVFLMEKVGLDVELFNRYPHQISGGQCQRVCLARVLGLKPEFIVFDEPLSSLDGPTQFKILELLENIKKEMEFTSIFISHDLNLVQKVSDQIATMDQGKIISLKENKPNF